MVLFSLRFRVFVFYITHHFFTGSDHFNPTSFFFFFTSFLASIKTKLKTFLFKFRMPKPNPNNNLLTMAFIFKKANNNILIKGEKSHEYNKKIQKKHNKC